MKVRNRCDEIWLETCENEELLEDWKKGSGRQVSGLCSVKDCSEPAEFGGCVQITDVDENYLLALQSSKPDSYHIIPLCENCLKLFGEEYEVKSGTYPVPCERIFCKPLRNPTSQLT